MIPAGMAPNPLAPYVPRLLVEWLRDAPHTRHRIISGTCVFADLSGYTAMTERLASHGRTGAEETGEILNDVFEALLSAAYDFGAGLVKWGGDAVLLLFHGPDHVARATRAAWVMQNTIARVGRVHTSLGAVRVRMSVGVHTGDFHFMLVGQRFRDLMVAGPAATITTRMESIALPGEVVLSDTTAALLPVGTSRPHAPEGHLLIEPPDAPLLPQHSPLDVDVDLDGLFDPILRDHLTASHGDFEHRSVSAAFVAFRGTDVLLASEGPGALYAAVDAVVTAIQDAAAEHGVVVLGVDSGQDGGKAFLASGAPANPGDDATRVLTAVTAITEAPTRLPVRAGVAHGRVFAGDYGAPFRRTYSLAGDVVNLAARLAQHADDGQVLASPEAVERSTGPFVLTSLPPVVVKGKREPIAAVGVARRAAVPHPRHAALPLIGRKAELAALLAAEADAAERHGRATEVCGEAGIGKSRLLAEYESLASAPILRVDGELYARGRPYASVQRLVRRALGVEVEAGADEVATVLADVLSSRAPHLTPWLPLLAIAAGTSVPPTAEVDALDATARAERLRRVTGELLALLIDRPATLVFNDTHAMDDASVALVRHLCTEVSSRPWSIVISRRSGGVDTTAFPNTSTLTLTALAEAEADELVMVASPIRIPAPRRAQLSEHAGGNPLFLRALTETVAAGQDLDVLPSEIEDVLTAHMDRLTPDERRWLRTAAVLGTRVDPAVLAEITDEPFDPASSPSLAEYIRPEPDGTLAFAHHLVQRTAYEALPFRRRRTLHARASYVIERRAGDAVADAADVLAIHCLRGQRFDAAWQYARTAGRRARDRYALVEAAANFDVALEAARSIPGLPARETADVAEDLAMARFNLGQIAETEAALKLARRHARGDTRRLARLALLTASQRQREGRHAEALRWIGRGRAYLDPARREDLRLMAELAELASVAHHTRQSLRQVRFWADRAAEEARLCGDSQREASALSQLAVAKSRVGEPWEPVDLAGSATWDLATYAEIINRLGVAAYYGGDLVSAERHYEHAESLSRRAGREARAATYAANRAEVMVDVRRFAEAIPLLKAAIDQLQETHTRAYLPFAFALLARATEQVDGPDVAAPHFESALLLAEESGDSATASIAGTWLASHTNEPAR